MTDKIEITPFQMSAGRCRFRNEQLGTVKKYRDDRGWLVAIDGGDSRHYPDNGQLSRRGDYEYDIVAMLPDLADDPEPLVIEEGCIMDWEAISRSAHDALMKAGLWDTEDCGENVMQFTTFPHTPAAPVKAVIEMDESWLFKWANWRAFGAAGACNQYEFKPAEGTCVFYPERGRWRVIPPEHAHQLPEGMDWRDTLTMVKKGARINA